MQREDLVQLRAVLLSVLKPYGEDAKECFKQAKLWVERAGSEIETTVIPPWLGVVAPEPPLNHSPMIMEKKKGRPKKQPAQST